MSEVLSAALKALEERKAEASAKGQVNDADLPAGSPMHYYCKLCGLPSDILPERHAYPPKRYCAACQKAIDDGSLAGSGIEIPGFEKRKCTVCGGGGILPWVGTCGACEGSGKATFRIVTRL